MHELLVESLDEAGEIFHNRILDNCCVLLFISTILLILLLLA